MDEVELISETSGHEVKLHGLLEALVCFLKANWYSPDGDVYVVVALYVMASWFPDLGGVAPYLAIIGPAGSGKTRLGELLELLCFNGKMVTWASANSVATLLKQGRRTLILDRLPARLPRSSVLLRLLCSGDRKRGTLLLGGQGDHDSECGTFGYKVLVATHGPENAELAARAIIVRATHSPPSHALEPYRPENVEEQAKAISNKLLAAVARHEGPVREAYYSPALLPNLSNRLRDVFAPLAAVAAVADATALEKLRQYERRCSSDNSIDTEEDTWTRLIQDFIAKSAAADEVPADRRYEAGKFVEFVNKSKLFQRPFCQREVTRKLMEFGLADRFRASVSANASSKTTTGKGAMPTYLTSCVPNSQKADTKRSQPIVYHFKHSDGRFVAN